VAVYDLGRGLCRHLRFSADAFVSELRQAQAAVADLPADTLVVGDRAFGHPLFFAHLQQHGCWGVVRRNRVVKLQRVRCLGRTRGADGELTDWEVRAGTGRTVPPQPLRWIRWRHGRTCYEVLTNVLAPERLSAAEAIALYTARWSVERMYFDLKDVLNLNRVYAANPNAVAMQVYAAGLVYNAMRVAQADAAAALGLAPEQLSPAKLYPRLAAACHLYFGAQLWEHAMRQLNPSRRLRWIDWHQQPWATVPVAAVTVEPRSDHRRHRRFCAARAHHTSFTRVRGGRRFTRLT
jgi:Transposase DDE domain